jgi:hypothetical protein
MGWTGLPVSPNRVRDESPKTAVGIGGWCEMAASLRGCEPGSKRIVDCWKMLPSSAVKTVTENASLCVICKM